MAENTTAAGDAQAATTDQPQAGTPAAPAAGGKGEPPESISLEEAHKLRNENQSLRARAKAAEDAAAQAAQANMTEAERNKARVAELERQSLDWERERQDMRLQGSVERAARAAGFLDPSDALALLDRSAVDFEKDGSPKNVDSLVTALAKAKPHLVRPANGSGGFDTGTGGRPAGKPTYTREQLRDTTFAQAHLADIQAAAREGRIIER